MNSVPLIFCVKANNSFFVVKKFSKFVTAHLILSLFCNALFAQPQSATIHSIGAQRDQERRSDPRLILSEIKFDSQQALEESKRSLQSALAFDPGNADYHFELARVYGAFYDETMKIPSKADLHYLDLSEHELQQVLMIRPNDIPAHYNLGVIDKRRKSMERARDEFRRVLNLSKTDASASPVSISAWMQIGATYEDQGFFDDACEAYMKAREIGGNQPEIQSALEDIRSRVKEDVQLRTNSRNGDSWTRQYVSGADYTQFGMDAIKAQNQRASGVGALLPVVGQMLFQQFMSRRSEPRKTSND